ncbi:DUF4410 domain-containing protein [Desulfatirhabdium butyrativorans]|uniref:DUF4410 domain-containing protein n=1 Tax=Desulfatirhabdium butyrativorans TaxID=340467 RepID=UPI0003F9BD9C|nr:DUF4410 domain-containing protein [Desulfatirhabdium butyrativorans]
MVRHPFPFKSATAFALILFIAGCAKTAVHPVGQIAGTQLPKPKAVLIADFAIGSAEIKQNAGFLSIVHRGIQGDDRTAEEIQLGREVADALSSELSLKIDAMGLQPVRVASGAAIPPDSILVAGNFVSIDEGNRRRRNLVGLGAGKSALDCTVSVFASGSADPRQLITFDAHIDSGKMPGVAVMGPAGLAAGAGTGAVLSSNAIMSGVKTHQSASTQLAKGLAEKIADELGKYFAKQGWIHPDSAR